MDDDEMGRTNDQGEKEAEAEAEAELEEQARGEERRGGVAVLVEPPGKMPKMTVDILQSDKDAPGLASTRSPAPSTYCPISTLRLPGHLGEDSLPVCEGCTCAGGDCGSPASECACARRSQLAGSRFECNPSCRCDPARCTRRTCQRPSRASAHLQVFSTPAKGQGLRTQQRIAKGEFVLLYLGEVISAAEAQKRTRRREEKWLPTYIITLREHVQEPSEHTVVTRIDATEYGNEARFINHSCDPSLSIEVVRWHFIPHLALYARRDIEAGEELTFDYGFAQNGAHEGGELSSCPSAQDATTQRQPPQPAPKKRQTHGVKVHDVQFSRTRCHCQAETCCGFLPHHL